MIFCYKKIFIFNDAKKAASDADIIFSDNGNNYQFQEKVKALTLADFSKLISHAGLKIIDIFGNYRLKDFNALTSIGSTGSPLYPKTHLQLDKIFPKQKIIYAYYSMIIYVEIMIAWDTKKSPRGLWLEVGLLAAVGWYWVHKVDTSHYLHHTCLPATYSWPTLPQGGLGPLILTNLEICIPFSTHYKYLGPRAGSGALGCCGVVLSA